MKRRHQGQYVDVRERPRRLRHKKHKLKSRNCLMNAILAVSQNSSPDQDYFPSFSAKGRGNQLPHDQFPHLSWSRRDPCSPTTLSCVPLFSIFPMSKSLGFNVVEIWLTLPLGVKPRDGGMRRDLIERLFWFHQYKDRFLKGWKMGAFIVANPGIVLLNFFTNDPWLRPTIPQLFELFDGHIRGVFGYGDHSFF